MILYRILHKPNTTSGIILAYYMCASLSLQALCTSVGYKSIIKIIATQKKSLAHGVNTASGSFRHHSIATQCLTTFVRIAEIIYCTLAIAAWVFVIQITLGVEEPMTVYTIIVTANCSGWANALGYFYNRRVKAKKALKHVQVPSASALPSSSTT